MSTAGIDRSPPRGSVPAAASGSTGWRSFSLIVGDLPVEHAGHAGHQGGPRAAGRGVSPVPRQERAEPDRIGADRSHQRDHPPGHAGDAGHRRHDALVEGQRVPDEEGLDPAAGRAGPDQQAAAALDPRLALPGMEPLVQRLRGLRRLPRQVLLGNPGTELHARRHTDNDKEPRLCWDMAWFISNKIGRDDSPSITAACSAASGASTARTLPITSRSTASGPTSGRRASVFRRAAGRPPTTGRWARHGSSPRRARSTRRATRCAAWRW